MTSDKRTATDAARDLNASDPMGHEWQWGRFTGTKTCAVCGLLPLDEDDYEIPCEDAR